MRRSECELKDTIRPQRVSDLELSVSLSQLPQAYMRGEDERGVDKREWTARWEMDASPMSG